MTLDRTRRPLRRRHAAVLAFTAISALMITACGSENDSGTTTTVETSTETVTVEATASRVPATTSAVAEPPAVVTSAPAPAPVAAPASMPAVVCMNLQDAQDLIQAAGVFYSRSDDATGARRNQVLDANWSVVAQSPEPGALVTEGEAVLSVVKLGEPGDCS